MKLLKMKKSCDFDHEIMIWLKKMEALQQSWAEPCEDV
jgi:hypothetical protein